MLSLDRKEVASKYAHLTPPWGPLGYVTFKRTYARRVSGESRTEEWWEACLRCVNGVQGLGADFTRDELWQLLNGMFELRSTPAGRGVWQYGVPKTNDHADSIINCWFVRMDTLQSFLFVMSQLMFGGGVGFSVRQEDISKLPPVSGRECRLVRKDTADADFLVPDSREGWVALIERVLQAYLVTGKGFSYSLNYVRARGSPIEGFGGTASGPEALDRLVQNLIRLFNSRRDLRLRSIDVLDINNFFGDCVVAGNVRRSAEIALGDPDDREYLTAKRWDKGPVPFQRGMSNNSCYVRHPDELAAEFWQPYWMESEGRAVGENYGFFNQSLCTRVGRTREIRPDIYIIGMNPCGEIGLANYESCNLWELYLPRVRSAAELQQLTRLGLRCCKTVCTRNYWWDETNEIVRRNMRIGIGVTGVLQRQHLAGDFSQLANVLAWNYDRLREFDREYSRALGLPESIRLTTVKPSGTMSLLPGVTSGLHGAYAEYFNRLITMKVDEPLVDACRAHGYHVEARLRGDGSEDPESVVVYFPCRAPVGARLAERMTAVEQLEILATMQEKWCDNAASNTVTYAPAELPAIRDWLSVNYENRVKSVSFLRHNGHGFRQAPIQPITEAEYRRLSAGVYPITQVQGDTSTEELERACAGGSCPVR